MSSTDTTPSIDKAEFVKRANAACRKKRTSLKRSVARFERRTAGKTPGRYADVVHFVFLPSVEEEVNLIEEAGTPIGEKERLRVLLAAQRAAIGAVTVKPHVASIAIAERHFIRAGRMFRAYGLSACAIGPRG